jgi:uncharacterized protein (TIGR02757 family)
MTDLKEILEEQYQLYNQPNFIPNDPISIPHQFTKKQDIEIAGLFASVLAWGQRKTIIKKCTELMEKMDNSPYEFVLNHQETDLKRFLGFKHRTFNAEDTLYFIHFLKYWYGKHESLETAFSQHLKNTEETIENALIGFEKLFFSLPEAPKRTRKHISTPARNSACKRLCMYLRWMVRKDDKGVDFGIWENISPSQLVCPCDVHVERIGRELKLITLPKTNWKMALELTKNLKDFDANDPVKYDFALFGTGVMEKISSVRKIL